MYQKWAVILPFFPSPSAFPLQRIQFLLKLELDYIRLEVETLHGLESVTEDHQLKFIAGGMGNIWRPQKKTCDIMALKCLHLPLNHPTYLLSKLQPWNSVVLLLNLGRIIRVGPLPLICKLAIQFYHRSWIYIFSWPDFIKTCHLQFERDLQ